MEFELNEILDLIENDFNNSCIENSINNNCNEDCKYYKCLCNNAKIDIENVRRLAAACFGSTYEK